MSKPTPDPVPALRTVIQLLTTALLEVVSAAVADGYRPASDRAAAALRLAIAAMNSAEAIIGPVSLDRRGLSSTSRAFLDEIAHR